MRHLRVLQVITIATATLLASCGTNDPTDNAPGDASSSETTLVAAATNTEPCVGIGDVFQPNVPGTYAAFAMRSVESLSTEVGGSHGKLLATSHPTVDTTAVVDSASALRFDIAPPQVFEVESSVIIHIQHDGFPYELVLVRVDGTREFSGWDVRPSVEKIVNESGSCLIGDLRETFRVASSSAVP